MTILVTMKLLYIRWLQRASNSCHEVHPEPRISRNISHMSDLILKDYHEEMK